MPADPGGLSWRHFERTLRPDIISTSHHDAFWARHVTIEADDVLNANLTQKLKKKVEEVPLSTSIKGLVGGKSSEILGDLQIEFMFAPEK